MFNPKRWIERKPELSGFFDSPVQQDAEKATDKNTTGICQCLPNADPLFDDFRDDIICETLRQFQLHGLKYKDLVEFSELVPTIYAWNERYDTLRQNVNRRFVVFPWVIVMAETVKHVKKSVKWAVRYNIPLATRSGSHCFEPYSLVQGIVIDQSSRQGIRVGSKAALIEAGVLLGPMAVELEKYNVAVVAGTCPNNGFSGFTLGGGIGLLLRKYGLGSDNVVAFQIVLANGKCIVADKNKHSDLYFGLKGAGNGNYGIVTSFKVKTLPIGRVTTFELHYPPTMLAQVLDIWQCWAPNTDWNLSSECNIFRDYISVDGLYLGNKEACEKLLGKLLVIALKSTVEEKTYVEAARQFSGTGVWPPFFKNKSSFALKPLSEKGYAVISSFMEKATPDDHLELGAFGGFVNKVPANATAFVHRDTLFWIHFQCKWNNQNEQEERIKWVRSFYRAMKPYLSGQCYQNVPDSDLKCPLERYYGKNLPRLVEIKSKYDPGNVFRYQQSIPTSLRIK